MNISITTLMNTPFVSTAGTLAIEVSCSTDFFRTLSPFLQPPTRRWWQTRENPRQPKG